MRMPIATRLKEFLDEHNIEYETLWHSPTYTAQGSAEKMHVSGKVLAKAGNVKSNGRFLMVVVEAPDHVDLKRLREESGSTLLALATETDFETLFPDCEPGAI